MTSEEVDATLDLIDKVAASTGQQSIRALLEQFSATMPADMRGVLMAQIKEDVAKSVKDGLSKTLAQMQRTVDDPAVIDAIRRATSSHEQTDNVTDNGGGAKR